jgi:hypothetical protein
MNMGDRPLAVSKRRTTGGLAKDNGGTRDRREAGKRNY